MMRIFLLVFCIGLSIGAPTTPGDGLCEVCHLLVADVQDLLTTGQTQNAISGYVSGACATLPSEEKDVCNSFLRLHSGKLFNKLIKDLTPYEFCGKLTDVCPVYDEVPARAPAVEEEEEEPTANPLECELCKLAVLAVDKLIKENRSAAAINDTLEKFCQGLPDQLRGLCLQVEPLILKGISSGFDPKVACKFATLCSASDKDDEPRIPCDICYTVMDAIGVADAESLCASQTSCILEAETERQQQQQQQEKETLPEVQDTLECQICKFAVQAIDTLLGENRSVAAINSTLIQLCNSLPGELKDSCLSVEPDILKAVLGGIDPSKACDFLKICNDEGSVPLCSQFIPCDVCKEALEAVAGQVGVDLCYKFKDVCGLEKPEPEPETSSEQTVETPMCDLCQFLIKSVDDLVQSDRSRDAVSGLLDFVCTPLPDEAKAFCTNHRESIISQVLNGINSPKQSCDEVEICKDNERDIFYVEEKEKETVTDDARCELCKFVLQLLDESLQNNASMEKVNVTLFGICNALPATYKGLCISLVPQVEAALAAGLDPTNSCIAANFCTPTTRLVSIEELKCETCARFVEGLSDEASIKVKNGACQGACRTRSRRSTGVESTLNYKIKQIMELSKLSDAAECELCHIFIRALDNIAGENKSIDTINKTVHDICVRLTGIQLQQVCLQEQPKIVQLLKAGIDPNKTCIAAKMCPPTNTGRIKKRSVVQLQNDIKMENIKPKLLDLIERKSQNNVGDLPCDICEGVVELLDQLIADNATDEKINQTLYSLCSGLPEGVFKDLCLQEAPAIMAAIEAGFDPEKTCEFAKLCTGAGKQKSKQLQKTLLKDSALLNILVSEQKPNHNVGDLACDICEGIVELLDQLVADNATDDKINQTLYKLCSGLPDGALKDLCLQEAPAIMQAVEDGFDPEKTCELAKLCTGTKQSRRGKSKRTFKQVRKTIDMKQIATDENKSQENVNNLKDLRCDVCKAVIEELDSVIEQNATFEKINETVYGLCYKLQGALQDLCLQAAPQIMAYLKVGADPSKLCASVGLCTSLDHEWVEQNVGDAKCDICTLIVQGLDEVVKTNTSAQKINETIQTLCSYISGTAKTYCVMVAPLIVNELKNGVDPEKACEVLKMCTATENIQILPANVGDIKCDICELLITEIDKLVGQNASAEKINSTIYGLCNNFPGAAKTYCLLAAPEIVKAVEGGVDPDKACEILKLCTSEEKATIGTSNVGDIKCDICELVIQEIDSIVGDNATDEKINATIYNLCSYLTGTPKTFCLLVAPEIVKAVEAGVDPEKACEALKLCTSVELKLPELSTNVGDLKCEVCQLLIRIVEEAYGGMNATQKLVNETIYTVCDELSGTFKTYCILIAPSVVNVIDNGITDPMEMCKKIDICINDMPATDIKLDVIEDRLDCDTCANSLEGAYEDISSNYMKVKGLLLKMCNNLPVAFRKPCETLIELDNGRVFKMMLSNYTPALLCEMANCQERGEQPNNNST